MSRVEIASVATGIGDCAEEALLLSNGESSQHVSSEIHLFSDNGKVYIGCNGKVVEDNIKYYPLTLSQQKLVSKHLIDYTLEDTLTKQEFINVCTYVCDYLLGVKGRIHLIEIVDKATLVDKVIVLPTLFKDSRFCDIINVLVGDAGLGRTLDLPSSLSTLLLDLTGEVV